MVHLRFAGRGMQHFLMGQLCRLQQSLRQAASQNLPCPAKTHTVKDGWLLRNKAKPRSCRQRHAEQTAVPLRFDVQQHGFCGSLQTLEAGQQERDQHSILRNLRDVAAVEVHSFSAYVYLIDDKVAIPEAQSYVVCNARVQMSTRRPSSFAGPDCNVMTSSMQISTSRYA